MPKSRSICWFGAFLFLAAMVTAPFDELLVVETNSVTVRYSLFLIILAGVTLLVLLAKMKTIVLPYGWKYLVLLLLWNGILCVLNVNTSMPFLLGYEIWFALDVAMLFLAVAFFSTERGHHVLLKAYLGIFDAMAVVCIIQFLVGLFGIQLFAEQKYGPLVRCDAFLSEPSYYACFAIPGWIFVTWMMEQKQTEYYSHKMLLISTGVITASLVFSTSRMGLLMMLLWIAFRFIVCLVKKTKLALYTVLKVAAVLALLLLLMQALSIGIAWIQNRMNPQTSYITHMQDTAGSDAPRVEGMKLTFETFIKRHLLVGSSLGGVSDSVANLTEAQQLFVSNLLAELSVALGIPGMVVLAAYLFGIIRLVTQQKRNSIAIPLFWGLIWQIGILQFNNNMLRIYVWVNIAVLSVFLPQKIWKGKKTE